MPFEFSAPQVGVDGWQHEKGSRLAPFFMLRCTGFSVRRAWLAGLKGGQLPIYGNGQNIRDWLFVLDHCNTIHTVLERGRVVRSIILVEIMKKPIYRLFILCVIY